VHNVAGDSAASVFHGAAEGALNTTKQAAGFTYGVGEGAASAAGDMVSSTVDLAKDGAKFVSDSGFRGQVIQGAEHLARAVANNPLGTAKAIGSGVVKAGEGWLRGAGQAAQEGNLGEYLGKGTGSAAINIGSFFIPGADAAEGANLAAHAGEAAGAASTLLKGSEALGDGGKLAEGGAALSDASKLDTAGGAVGDAVKLDRGAAAAGTDGTPSLRLRGENYTIPGWHTEPITYTKRAPEALAKLRREFDGGVRSSFLKDLGTNHEDALRASGLNDAQVARVKSGRVPQGYQVHHYLPLDDGGTNAPSNLVLIRNDPEHMLVTNHQNALTRGMTPGDSRELGWPMPDSLSKVWPDSPTNTAIKLDPH
jgi:hypothetical protein